MIIRLLTAAIVVGASVCYFSPKPPPYQPKYQTIAHRFLKLESTYVDVPNESWAMLDDIITEVKSRTHYDPSITNLAAKQAQFLAIFNTIDTVLAEKNFIFPPVKWTSTLGESFASHHLDDEDFAEALKHPHNGRRVVQMKANKDGEFHLIACSPSAFLYMGVAEAMGFEMKPVLLPKHIYVRADLDATHWINWDANRGMSINDEDYISNWGVEEDQINANVYMQPLSPEKIDAQMYTLVGTHMGNLPFESDRLAAVECFRKAIQGNPRDLYALNNLALHLLFVPDLDSATINQCLDLTKRVVGYQPWEPGFQATRSYAFAAAGKTDDAVAAMTKAIELDPKNTEFVEMLPLIQSGYTEYGGIKARAPVAFWIFRENGWLYVLIFIAALIAGGITLLIRRRRAKADESDLPTEQPTLAI